MEAFYFGVPGRKLFGIDHAPSGCDNRDCGVILCSPMGREYLGALKAYRLLATQLSDLGFPVLRFDFFACGDSEGDCREGSVARWCEDILAAAGEMRRRHGLTRFCFLGLRLGGSIAMMAETSQLDLQALVLWDPVVQGDQYLRELRLSHRKAFPQTPDDELLGFAFGDRLRGEISSVDLLTLEARLPEDVLLIQTSDGRADKALRERLAIASRRLEWRCFPGERISIKDVPSGFRSLTRGRTISLISSWIDRVCR